MADATPADILRSRIRKYFLVVLAMFAGAAVFLVILGVVVKTLGLPGAVVGIAAPVAMLSVVAGSWFAVSKLWRCPACDANVYWLISWNMSVFAASAQSNCPGCGVELFTVAGRKARTRRFLILIGLSVGLGVLGAIASGTMAQKQRAQQTKPVPPG